MLKGIDISSWQGDIDLSPLPIDFAIMKATEGVDYVSPYCDPKVQQCMKLGKLWGFYHYGLNNDPIAEAEFFFKNTSNYFRVGIPVLDWEEDQNIEWVNKFVKRIYELSGVWCWIYGNPWRFNQGGVEPNCGRWIAYYPNFNRPTLEQELDDIPFTDGLVCCWQFASDGKLDGYNGNLDLDYFFGDKEAWLKYANPNYLESEAPTKPIEDRISTLENELYKVTVEKKDL